MATGTYAALFQSQCVRISASIEPRDQAGRGEPWRCARIAAGLNWHIRTHAHAHTSLGIPGPGLRSRPPSVGCAIDEGVSSCSAPNKRAAPFVSLVGPPPSSMIPSLITQRISIGPVTDGIRARCNSKKRSNQRCRDQFSVLIPVLSFCGVLVPNDASDSVRRGRYVVEGFRGRPRFCCDGDSRWPRAGTTWVV
jgi:hypothetical protein